jgi:hypothetical protein
MAYEGRITYLDAPFDGVNWLKDHESSFHTDASGGSRRIWEASTTTPPLPLKSNKAHSLRWDQIKDQIAESITFDLDPSPYQTKDIRCIILGKTKASLDAGSLNYIMAIAPSSGYAPDSYVRVGVGVVSDDCIDWTSEHHVEVR